MSIITKFIILIILFLLALTVNLTLGSVIFPFEIWQDLVTGEVVSEAYLHILSYRFDKAIVAVLSGAALSLSGLFMQAVFRNPIAGPYVLGTSAAAGLGVALLILGSAITGFSYLSGISLAFAAILGSVTGLIGIILLYKKLKSAVNLLIAGLMLGIFAGAVINILSFFTQAEALQKFVFWSMGNLGNLSKEYILVLSVISLLVFTISLFYVKPLNALLIGENYAKSMGVNVYKTNYIIIILSGILTGVVTAFAGPIAFVGLAVPHITRLYFNTHLHQILIPGVLLIGSILLLLCDTIAQLPGSDLSLPINSVTALFGAPLVTYLIINKT